MYVRFGETHKHGHDAERMVIIKANLVLEPTIIGSWIDYVVKVVYPNCAP